MTIREDALAGKETELFTCCAANEHMDVATLMAGVADGTIVITKNDHHDFQKIRAIGKGVSTKINANIGSSRDIASLDVEIDYILFLRIHGLGHGLVDGHGSQGDGTVFKNAPAHLIQIPAHGQIHNRISARLNRNPQFLDFDVKTGNIPG